jgi:amidase
MKIVSEHNVIYTFDPDHKPVEHVKVGETLHLRTQDAFGGQIRSEENTVDRLDWTKVDGATGPVSIEGAEPGDTLVVEILNMKTENTGVIATIPGQGILGTSRFKPFTRIVEIQEGYVAFERGVMIKAKPMIGTIGVTPQTVVPCGSLGRHGGNMDVKELTAGARLYLPVFVEGGLFAAGDLHAVQADGELCVSAIEVAGEIRLRFRLIKNKNPEWPILETKDSFALLSCGDTLDEAVRHASKAAVEALVREHRWPFENAYMFASLAVDLEINQVVDPKKGVRAVIPKRFMNLDSLLT